MLIERILFMKKKTSVFTKILIIILVLELIALAGIFAVFKFFKSSAATQGSSNTTNSEIYTENSGENTSASYEESSDQISESTSAIVPDTSNNSNDNSASLEPSSNDTNIDTNPISANTTTSNNTDFSRKEHNDSEKNMSDQVNIDVNVIYQLPELPTGCEITSLDMVLNYMGYSIDKVTLSDNYLDKGTIGIDSYKKVFLGDPKDSNSYGCFAPVIVNAANKYLTEQNSSLHAYNLTGSELNELFDNIRCGLPVIIWGSLNPNINITYNNTWIVDSEILKWPANEHCMVLTGFDLANNTVTINDPLKGVCTYDYNAFLEYYVELGRQAVVIDYYS